MSQFATDAIFRCDLYAEIFPHMSPPPPTNNYAQLRTTSQNYAQLLTTTHNDAQLRTSTHNYAQWSIL